MVFRECFKGRFLCKKEEKSTVLKRDKDNCKIIFSDFTIPCYKKSADGKICG
jgi:hypothetical protein